MQAHSNPKTALPLLVLLVLASGLGVAVAVVLAVVTMLLAAPAYADDGRLLLERRAGLERTGEIGPGETLAVGARASQAPARAPARLVLA